MKEPHATFGEDGNATETGFAHCYSYSGETSEFLGEFNFWTLIGSGIPANTTMTPPPEVTTGMVATFKDGDWVQEEDHRGETVYSTDDQSSVLVSKIGDYPDGFTPIKPATVYDKWDGTKWETDGDAKKERDIAEANRQKQIVSADHGKLSFCWASLLMMIRHLLQRG